MDNIKMALIFKLDEKQHGFGYIHSGDDGDCDSLGETTVTRLKNVQK